MSAGKYEVQNASQCIYQNMGVATVGQLETARVSVKQFVIFQLVSGGMARQPWAGTICQIDILRRDTC